MKVRPAWKRSIEEAMPYDARVLMNAYRQAPNAPNELYIQIPLSPPSANKMYRKTTFTDKITGKLKPAQFLDKLVKDFREMTMASCWGKSFVPKGVLAGMMVVESNWVTMEHKVREKDVDNPVKCTLDAVSKALKFDDSLLWSMYSAKLFSRREVTHVWLFDLSDVVNAIGGQHVG